jgi:hypothetical protein
LAAVTIPVLIKAPTPENISGLALSGFSLGILWWTSGPRVHRWVDIGAGVLVSGLAVYLNQNWFLDLSVVSAPIELSAAGTWLLGIATGFFLRARIQNFRIPVPAFNNKFRLQIKFPEVSLPQLPFKGLFSAYYFFVILVLVITAAILWGVHPIYDSL